MPVVNCPAEQQPSAKTSAPELLSSHSELRDLLGERSTLTSPALNRSLSGDTRGELTRCQHHTKCCTERECSRQHLLREGVGEAARSNHG